MQTLHIAKTVVQKLVNAGFIAYFAGGWVRDFLLQKTSDDIDIATNASVDEVQALFSKTIPVGIAFGIVIVVEGHHQFEVATFRKDRGYIDGRRPEGIEPAAPEEDAQRRDFTINGMFYDPLNNQLLDYVNGQIDLKKGIIRAIGDPHARFLEDRLRMMRAVRYSTRFNFPIEAHTLQAILAHAQSLLPSVAMERIWQEFKKMSQFAHFDAGLVTLHELNLLPTIFPALKDLSKKVVQERLKAIPYFPKDAPPIAELLELFPNSSLEQTLGLCEFLKLSNQEKEFVRFLHHAQSLLAMPDEWLKNLELIEWAQFYAVPHSEVCLGIISARMPLSIRESFLKQHAVRRQSLKLAIGRIQSKTPVVRAEHLMQEGIVPGKKMGLLLKEAERLSVNEAIDDKATLINLLKSSTLWEQ